MSRHPRRRAFVVLFKRENGVPAIEVAEQERTSASLVALQRGEAMATYKQIADHVFAQSGRRVHHECWIAHVLADYGLTKRVAPNRQGADRKKKCPVDMRPKIVDALQHFGMIDPR